MSSDLSTTTDRPPTDEGLGHGLPAWSTVLAVVAHPDDESFGLGAVIDCFQRRGTKVAVLCLTRGEASTLGAVHGAPSDLSAVREAELRAAAEALGVHENTLREHPDGQLARLPRHLLADDVIDESGRTQAQGLLVFDSSGVSGHPDHAAATAAALLAAGVLDLPVLAWAVPEAVADTLNAELGSGFLGRAHDDLDLVISVDRRRQLAAATAHASQATPSSVLWRRLELLGDREYLRWLRAPAGATTAAPQRSEETTADATSVQVRHLHGDRFQITVRGHVLGVDQPVALGGEDVAPTPTELFVASLVSCVAFYARRYLARHQLPEVGFAVDADYDLAEHPSRVGAVRIRMRLPDGFPEERRKALLAVASHCTVQNTLNTAPEVSIG